MRSACNSKEYRSVQDNEAEPLNATVVGQCDRPRGDNDEATLMRLPASLPTRGTIGRMPTGSLIAPADLAAAVDLAQELGALRELPLAPYATRTESTANYRRPNAIHGNGSPSLPQNAIFADWAHWRDHGRLNAWRRGGALHGHAPARPDSAAHIPSTRTSCDPLGKLIAKTRKGEHAEEKRGEQRSARSEGARATTRA